MKTADEPKGQCQEPIPNSTVGKKVIFVMIPVHVDLPSADGVLDEILEKGVRFTPFDERKYLLFRVNFFQ
jgi:hypothetical protein